MEKLYKNYVKTKEKLYRHGTARLKPLGKGSGKILSVLKVPKNHTDSMLSVLVCYSPAMITLIIRAKQKQKEGAMFCPSCGHQNPENVGTCLSCKKDLPASNSPSINYGGFWRRAVAFLIDSTIINIPLYLLGMAFLFGAGLSYVSIAPDSKADLNSAADVIGGIYSILYTIVQIVATWLYYALFEGSGRQATPGKMLLGIKVADLEGKRVTYAKATGRYWAKMVSFLTFGIGFIMAGLTKRKQALHDIIASTLVIKG